MGAADFQLAYKTLKTSWELAVAQLKETISAQQYLKKRHTGPWTRGEIQARGRAVDLDFNEPRVLANIKHLRRVIDSHNLRCKVEGQAWTVDISAMSV